MPRPPERPRPARTLFWLAAVVFAGLVLRLWHLQVVQGPWYQDLAVSNRLRLLPVPAPRGEILDRHGLPLATIRNSFTASLLPGRFDSSDEDLLQRLGAIIDMTPEEILDALEEGGRGYAYEPVRIRRDLPQAAVIALEEQRDELPGVVVEQEPTRSYPEPAGVLAGHVLGYLAPVTVEQLRQDPSYRGTDLVGRTGLEATYERFLRGKEGRQELEVNALGRPVQVLGREPPVPGHDLVLALDARLQAAVEGALTQKVDDLRATGKYPDARGGAAVVMDPRTGEVLAMASVPGFDSERMSGSGRAEYYASLERDPRLPLLNRATFAKYPPGSAFKPVTALAILRSGAATPRTPFHADGFARTGGLVKTDWWVPLGLPSPGTITLSEAITQSINDYFWEMGVRAGVEAIAREARAFGFGKPTGIDLAPEERAGTVPDPAWKARRYATSPPQDRRWFESETMDVAIGQGALEVTVLQMAQAFSAVANRGTYYRPQMVREIHGPGGDMVRPFRPEPAGRVEAPAAWWQAIVQGMEGVVRDRKGTARTAFAGFPREVSVAGKTGSVEVTGKAVHGWFAGFAPVERPEVVVVVFIEHAGGGGSTAAPVGRQILEAYFGLGPETGR
ncbi:penicillin-binding protein 2 [Limnochorda pilosa]|uniref:Peptidoglycan glycosyltransferase n=1 Tax=Limnochorda pilosa TaxID=1555112 RepID=A0A0K2SND1_LIMPI|nr:penicillin-binding protein 2 [Limnochorda pilosa]BAS28616.1 peptidoglycan glycosyltransferase [Limnochorda pilosa]